MHYFRSFGPHLALGSLANFSTPVSCAFSLGLRQPLLSTWVRSGELVPLTSICSRASLWLAEVWEALGTAKLWDLRGGGQLMSAGPDVWTFDQRDKGAWDGPTRWSYQLLLLFSGGLLSNAYFNICLLSFSVSFPFSSFLFSYVPVHRSFCSRLCFLEHLD